MFRYFIFFYLFIINISYTQGLVINEIMSNNNSCVLDKDGEPSDWIELYNPTNDSINLNNYTLSDDANILNKWTFPNIHISAQGTLIIFASGKNLNASDELHTNFKLSSAGEFIYLSNSEETIIDYILPVILEEDESYGRLPDGSTNVLHLDVCTPNLLNNNTNQLVFSTRSGFYSQAFNLHIQSFLGDTIYYSLDGSLPNPNSNLFEDSIFIYNKNLDENYVSEFPTSPNQSLIDYPAWEPASTTINKSNIIRCISYSNGEPSSKVYTQTYFVDNNIENKYNLPIISIVTEELNFFSSDSGIYVPGIYFDEHNPNWTGNYFQKGRLSERPVHVEYFDEDGLLQFSQDAGVRIHGGKTRQAAQKSLRLYARKEYGKKYFNYALLHNDDINQYKRFIIQTSMGCWNQSIIKDVVAHNIVNNLNLETQRFQPTIVFLNGEYWGIHTIREYIDEHYINDKYDNEQEVEILEGYMNAFEEFNNLFNVIQTNELDTYEYLKTKIDIENYISYQLSQMFFANYDWPGNNVKLWRFINEPEKKWRFIFYDLDASMGDPSYNMFQHCTNTDTNIDWPNPTESTEIFRRLLEYSEFKEAFINRAAQMLHDYDEIDVFVEQIRIIKDLYTNELNRHIDRWNFPNSYTNWESSVNDLMHFLAERPCEFTSHLMDFFNLSEFEFICDNNLKNSCITLFPNPNNGYFSISNTSYESLIGNLYLLNAKGQIVYQKTDFSMQHNQDHIINLSGLSAGLYMMNFIHSTGTENKTFIISK